MHRRKIAIFAQFGGDLEIGDKMKTIWVRYDSSLISQRGLDEEAVRTFAASPEELYKELRSVHCFSLSPTALKSAVNDEFVPMNTPLWEGDIVTFVGPATVN